MEENPLVAHKPRPVQSIVDEDEIRTTVRSEDPINFHGSEWLWIAIAIILVMVVVLVLWTLIPVTTVSIVMLSTLLLLGVAAFLYIRRLNRLDRPVRRH